MLAAHILGKGAIQWIIGVIFVKICVIK